MTVTIHPDIARRLFDGLTSVHFGPDSATLLNAQGETLAIGEAPLPPVIVNQPSLQPASAALGDSVTIDLGTATGRPAPEVAWQLTLNGASVTERVDEFMAIELSEPGLYELQVTWTNINGTIQAEIVGLLVEEVVIPEIDYTRALVYIDATTPIEGTDNAVTAINAIGSAQARLIATGTGNAVQRNAQGFVFDNGIWLQSQNLTNLPAGDGMFAVVDFTITAAGTSGGQILNGAGSRVSFSSETGQLRAQASDDTNLNVNAGATPYGTRVILAGRIDDLLDTFDLINVSGATVSTSFVNTDPNPTRFNCGRYLIGTIHRIAVFGRPEGGAWPHTMEEVHADFRVGA